MRAGEEQFEEDDGVRGDERQVGEGGGIVMVVEGCDLVEFIYLLQMYWCLKKIKF